MVLLSGMDPPEDGENWMEEQWEKWLTHEFSLDEFEDEDLSDVTEITDKYQEDDHVASWLANSEADRGVEGGWDRQGLSSLELIDAEETAETEGGGEGEQKEATGGGGEEEVVEEDLVRAAEERLKWRDKTGEGEEEEAVEEEEGGERKATLSSPGGEESSSAVVAMDTFRPKRPTTLALFPPQQPKPPRSQDTINNNSLGRKDSRKESRSASPHVSGAQHKEEDKGRHKRPAPKPPLTKGAVGRTSSSNNTNATPAADAPHTRPRDRPPPPPGTAARTQSAGGAPTRSQRRGAGGRGGAGGGTGRGGVVMRDRTLGENRGNKDVVGGSGGKEERRGRLCDDAKAKEKDKNGPQRSREGLKAKGAHDGKGRGAARASSRGGGGGGVKSTERAQNNPPVSQEIYLTAMVVPRTPVVPRNQEKTQEPVGDPDRSQDCPSSNMSRSSSSSTNSNRMSIGSDTEGPPGLSLRDRSNPDISEEEGEEDTNHHLHPLSKQNGPTQCLGVNHDDGITTTTETDCTESGQRRKVDPGGGRVDNEIHGGQDDCVNSNPTTTTADDDGGFRADRQTAAVPHSESAAGLNYDSVKYTLVVDEHAQLELVSLKNCYNSSCTSAARDDDSHDAETIYQSANEEEDPELDDERKKKEEKRPGKCKQVRQIEEERERREELLKRIEEERQRRRGMVTVSSRLSKQVAASRSTSAEDDASGATGRTPRSKKFLNLFVNSSTSSHYSATGAESFGLFSCVLDGVERMQSHRAVYRFVPRHADELHLDKDDPVLMLAQSEDLWCQGYNMRSGATGIFPAFYAVKITKDASKVHKDGWIERFFVRFLGSVQVPFHQGNDVLSAAMQKVACNRRSAMQPPSSCVLEVSVKGLKMSVQDLCHAADRGDQCFHFFQLKNISFCGCHPKHNKYFGFISKHPDQERFACHVVMSDMTSMPLAESVGRAFKQYYKEHVGYSCPTEDIFIE